MAKVNAVAVVGHRSPLVLLLLRPPAHRREPLEGLRGDSRCRGGRRQGPRQGADRGQGLGDSRGDRRLPRRALPHRARRRGPAWGRAEGPASADRSHVARRGAAVHQAHPEALARLEVAAPSWGRPTRTVLGPSQWWSSVVTRTTDDSRNSQLRGLLQMRWDKAVRSGGQSRTENPGAVVQSRPAH